MIRLNKLKYIVLILIAFFFIIMIPNFSNAANVTVGKVKNLKIESRETNTLKIKWNKVNNANGYRIYVYNDSTKKYEYYSQTTYTSMTLANLKSSKRYKVKVRAYKLYRGKKYYGNYSSVLKTVTKPVHVKMVEMTSQTNNSVQISWSKVARATGYKVFLYNEKTKQYDFYASSLNNSMTIKQLDSAKSYRVRIKAYRSFGNKSYNSRYSGTLNVATKPEQVSNLKVISKELNIINFSWDKVERATGYMIYQYDNNKNKWKKIAETDETNIKIEDLKIGTIYKYKVKAYANIKNNKYTGKSSSTLMASTVPEKVKNLKSTKQTSNSIFIEWDKMNDNVSYEVEMYSINSGTYKYYDTTNNNSMEIVNLDTAKFYRMRVKAFVEIDGVKIYGEPSDIINQKTSKTDNIRAGMDVSYYQGDVDWKKVKDSGIEFLILRIGYRGYGEAGRIVEDGKFKEYLDEISKYGFEYGIYFYSCAKNEEEVKEEIEWITNKIKEYKIEKKFKYLAYDFEEYGTHRTRNITKKQTNKNAILYLNLIKKNGFTPVLYGNKTYFEQIFDMDKIMSEVDGCKIWYAQYNDRYTYKGYFDMWQYTSDGIIDGINGKVDLNIVYF